ncbi:E3 Ubiquitin ligase [Musa troglodytarum]|uniref:RING-type E3 ubiquitin transferase n=1 Tax=Musa troglodytarum TaxID=320322 RepID=A0A9E7GRW1_9LILI|nr:E3 Ubiquitin ligase [Musa troglodytarum]
MLSILNRKEITDFALSLVINPFGFDLLAKSPTWGVHSAGCQRAVLLDTACKVLPLVVTVTGRVGSETPINCEQSGLRGVIVEETAEQHFLKHNDAGSWIQDSALMLSMSKEVPWYLDDGSGRVYVVGARGATGLVLTVASEVFEDSGRSLVRGTLDYLQGLKMLGVKRTERILPTGTALTIVGFADNENILNRWYQFASTGFTVFGVFLLAKHALQYILERRRRRELQKRVLSAAAARQARDAEGSNQETEKLSDNTKKDHLMLDICVICLEQEYNAVFVPAMELEVFGYLFDIDVNAIDDLMEGEACGPIGCQGEPKLKEKLSHEISGL